MTTKVLPCSCQHSYQDQAYGKGKRLYNQGDRISQTTDKYRCTVCGTTKPVEHK